MFLSTVCLTKMYGLATFDFVEYIQNQSTPKWNSANITAA